MRYRILGQTGLRVSELALGTGNFGKGWGYGSDRAEAQKIYTGFREAGGNFVDTADQYQFGQSETLLADFLGNERDEIVLASKYSLGDRAGAGVLHTGNSRKTMLRSVEASLRRLKTDRLDLLWVHMPDGVTPVDEIMRGFDDLVRAGKILYAGLSDFPAWRVAAAATLAEFRGWSPLAAVQLEYSLVERSPERELLPMASAFGLGVLGWSPLGGGLLTGKYRRGETGRAEGLRVLTHRESDTRKTATVDAVLQLAQETGRTAGQIAIGWIRTKGVLPIIGPRTPEQLADNLGSVDVALTAKQVRQLDDASAIPAGFPHEIVAATLPALFGGKLGQTTQPVRAAR